MESYLTTLRKRYPSVEIKYYQSNVEGELINKMQEVGFSYDGIILNAGAYTHTSIALLDCIRSLQTPIIEVHISNVNDREEFRRHSIIGPGCKGTIQGFGLDSYRLAIPCYEHSYDTWTHGKWASSGSTSEDVGTHDTPKEHSGGRNLQWLLCHLHG